MFEKRSDRGYPPALDGIEPKTLVNGAGIGSQTPQQVEAAVAPYISHENTAWLHSVSPGFICTAEVLQCLKIADPPSLDPDIAGRLSLADFLAGRDPDLETALHAVP